MPTIKFDPNSENGGCYTVGHVSIPSGKLLIVDPCYLRDEPISFWRAMTMTLADADSPFLGDDFCIPPGSARAVAVVLPTLATPLPVHARLGGTHLLEPPVRGLWIPFDSSPTNVVLDLDEEHWLELGSFSVDGGMVALFDSSLADANWDHVNSKIDERIKQDLYRETSLGAESAGTLNGKGWPVDEAERLAIAHKILESHAFQLSVKEEVIMLSRTGHGDGRYQVFSYLPEGKEAPHLSGGIWIDFGIMEEEVDARSLSDEQINILLRMQAQLPERTDRFNEELLKLGAGGLFQQIAHLLWQARLRRASIPLPVELIDAALQAALRDEYVASEALSNSNIGKERLAALASSKLEWERACAAQNPLTAAGDLARLAAERNASTVIYVAANPSTPSDALRILASSKDHDIREAVASNPATPADVVASLARDRKYIVRSAAVKRGDLSPELVRDRIVNDPSAFIRADLVRRHDLPEGYATKAILGLARMLCAGELDHFTDLLDRIGPDDLAPSDYSFPALRHVAESRGPMSIDDFKRIEQEGNLHRCASIAVRPDCPTDILARFAAGNAKLLRRLVAANPSTPVESLSQLLELTDDDGAILVLQNPSLPKEALVNVLRNGDLWFADMAAAHPNLRFQDVLALLREYGRSIPSELLSRPDCVAESICELAKSAVTDDRLLVAEHHRTPPHLLDALAQDCESEVRKGVAGNPNTPYATLAAMMHDPDNEVVMTVATSGRLDPKLVASVVRARPDGTFNTSQCIKLLSQGIPICGEQVRTLATKANRWELPKIAKAAATPLDLVELLALAVSVDDVSEKEDAKIIDGKGTAGLGDLLSELVAAALVA